MSNGGLMSGQFGPENIDAMLAWLQSMGIKPPLPGDDLRSLDMTNQRIQSANTTPNIASGESGLDRTMNNLFGGQYNNMQKGSWGDLIAKFGAAQQAGPQAPPMGAPPQEPQMDPQLQAIILEAMDLAAKNGITDPAQIDAFVDVYLKQNGFGGIGQ